MPEDPNEEQELMIKRLELVNGMQALIIEIERLRLRMALYWHRNCPKIKL